MHIAQTHPGKSNHICIAENLVRDWLFSKIEEITPHASASEFTCFEHYFVHWYWYAFMRHW